MTFRRLIPAIVWRMDWQGARPGKRKTIRRLPQDFRDVRRVNYNRA